jgi:hypothetical protein
MRPRYGGKLPLCIILLHGRKIALGISQMASNAPRGAA